MNTNRLILEAFLFLGAVAVDVSAQTTQLEDTKLLASDGLPQDFLGHSVSVDGDTLAAGAWGSDPGGAVYLFQRNGSRWLEEQILAPEELGPVDTFGFSVALDGETLVVGNPSDNDLGSGAGAAHIFVREARGWVQEVKLFPAGGGFRSFGLGVAIDGDTIVVGAPSASPGGIIFAGEAYVFVRSRLPDSGRSVWTQQAYLVASDASEFLCFGESVAIAGDTIGIQAPSVETGFRFGATYLFERTGQQWTEYPEHFPPGRPQLSGQTFVNGVQVFVREGATWELQAQLEPGVPAARAIAVEGDACVVSDCAGFASLFTRSGTRWTEQVILQASDGLPSDFLGWPGASLSGNTVVLGASRHDALGSSSGAAYVFTIDIPECFLVIGQEPRAATFGGATHVFQTQVGPEIETSYAVLMESIPEFPLPPLVGDQPTLTGQGLARLGGPSTPTLTPEPAAPFWLLDGQVTVQVLLWNPMVFPQQPEQYSAALLVEVRADGTVSSEQVGQGQGDLTVWAEVTENEQGQRVLRFPFLVGGL